MGPDFDERPGAKCYQADFRCCLPAGVFAAVSFAGFLPAIGNSISLWPAAAFFGALASEATALRMLCRNSTVYDGQGMLFDLNFCAFGIASQDAYRLARDAGKGDILKPGEHLTVCYAQHYSRADS
jgi:hypothetical protein